MALGRKTGGRQKGTPNKATAEIRSLAQAYGPAIVERLAIMAGVAVDTLGQPVKGADSDAAQIAAMKELLDRAYGKVAQPLSGDDNAPAMQIDFRWADTTVTPLDPSPNDAAHFVSKDGDEKEIAWGTREIC